MSVGNGQCWTLGLMLGMWMMGASVFAASDDTASDKTYTKTKYPIVLVHGMAMFDQMLGVSGWYGIPRHLRKGGADVYVIQVSALNTTELRGEQAARQIETILATTGAEKVNLIGHSHGSPTSRYLAGVYSQYVASVTSVHGVNWGTPVADQFLEQLAAGETTPLVMKSIMNIWGKAVNLLTANPLPQDYVLELEALSTAKANAFNREFPSGMPQEYCGQGDAMDENGIYYFSWTGNQVKTNVWDIADYGMTVTAAMMDEENDGLVPVCSTYLGTVIRDDYFMNHMDAIDQLFGLHSSKDTDPTTVYRQHANRLKNMGL